MTILKPRFILLILAATNLGATTLHARDLVCDNYNDFKTSFQNAFKTLDTSPDASEDHAVSREHVSKFIELFCTKNRVGAPDKQYEVLAKLAKACRDEACSTQNCKSSCSVAEQIVAAKITGYNMGSRTNIDGPSDPRLVDENKQKKLNVPTPEKILSRENALKEPNTR